MDDKEKEMLKEEKQKMYRHSMSHVMAKAIKQIYKKYENILKPKTMVQRLFLDYIKEHPIFSIGKAQSDLNLSYNGVSSIVLKMKDLGIVNEINGKKQRNRVFGVGEYLATLKHNL